MALAILSACGVVAVVWLAAIDPRATVKKTGAPASFSDLAADPIPDEKNAAAALDSALPLLEKQSVRVADLLGELGGAPLDPSQLEEARALLAKEAAALEAVLGASRRADYATLLTADEMADMQRVLDSASYARPAMRLLSLASRTRLAEGEVQAAVDTTIAALRLYNLFAREPFLIGRLLANAMQRSAVGNAAVLAASGKLSHAQAEQLTKAVLPLADRSSMADALRSERVMALYQLSTWPLPTRVWERGPLLRRFEEAIDLAEQPLDEVVAAIQKPPAATRGMLGRLTDPALKSFFEAEIQTATQAEAVIEKLRDADPGG
ncbi:hypothetical protein [Botrimarina sp.]|uniref:hypothetical protein n=1 Tax=Botrimarina sp. TaxID=2795802 RepID=UPI0032F00123